MGADQKRKEARKRKFGTQANLEETEQQTPTRAALQNVDPKRQPSEKQEVRSSVANFADKPSENHTSPGKDGENPVVPTTTGAQDEEQGKTEHSTGTKNQRYIVFIGNLPFTATDDSITKHFAKVHPQSIRHRTDRTTGKSKGFAFLEFNAYDRMKTCLKLYHHSNFDDGQSPARRLNVELTVGGGGGKSKDRKAKLRLKNVKLNEERQRRAESEKDAKTEGKTGDTKSAKGHRRVTTVGDEASGLKSGTDELHGDIHPSRRNRLLL